MRDIIKKDYPFTLKRIRKIRRCLDTTNTKGVTKVSFEVINLVTRTLLTGGHVILVDKNGSRKKLENTIVD